MKGLTQMIAANLQPVSPIAPGSHAPYGTLYISTVGNKSYNTQLTGPLVPGKDLKVKSYVDAVKAVHELKLVTRDSVVALVQGQDGAFLAMPLSLRQNFVQMLNSRGTVGVGVVGDDLSLRGVVSFDRDFEAQFMHTMDKS